MEPLRQVILIEDDADATQLAQQIAEDFGIDLIVCADGRTGRLAIEANPGIGVITDHDLPDMAGADLADIYPDRDVVVFTGHDIPGTVPKPQDPDRFEVALELLIDAMALVVPPDEATVDRLAERFPGGVSRLQSFMERILATCPRVAEELASGDVERIGRICHEFSPSIGIVGFQGLAATLRRMEVACRDGLEVASVGRILAGRIERLRIPLVAVA